MYAGGQASTLCGVFQGTVGWSGCAGRVDSKEANRGAETALRRHCSRSCGRARSEVAERRGGGIMCAVLGDVEWLLHKRRPLKPQHQKQLGVGAGMARFGLAHQQVYSSSHTVFALSSIWNQPTYKLMITLCTDLV